MEYKNTKAERDTVTRDMRDFEAGTDNTFETIAVIAKRANQIGADIKEELNSKLAEFATTSDNLEEIFENREQIEISKFYEALPKPVSIAGRSEDRRKKRERDGARAVSYDLSSSQSRSFSPF